jgi:hypothetical protein
MTDEQKAAAKVKRDAKKAGAVSPPPPSTAAPVPDVDTPAHADREVVPAVASVNLEKLTPSQSKVLVTTATDLFATTGKEKDEKEKFLVYVNGLSKADFDAKKLPAHMKDFYKPPAPKVEEPVEEEEEECTDVVFKGKTYVVGLVTKRVWVDELDKKGEVVAIHQVGMLGMAEFAKMKIPAA